MKKNKKIDVEKEIKRLKLRLKLNEIIGWTLISLLIIGIFYVIGSVYV
jgi:hypothetical protein